MNPQFIVTRHHIVTMIVAVVLSALIATGLLSAVAGLFLRDGTPFEQVVVAERACANYAYMSEREVCARAFRGNSQISRVASRQAWRADPCAHVESGEVAITRGGMICLPRTRAADHDPIAEDGLEWPTAGLNTGILDLTAADDSAELERRMHALNEQPWGRRSRR